MEFSLNLTLSSVSFGQTSIAILREIKRRGLVPPLSPIGPVDLSAQKEDDDFNRWLSVCISRFNREHNRKNPTVKLWHLQDSLGSLSEKQILISFYELDQPTESEKNIARNNKRVLFSSEFTCEVFRKNGGCDNIGYIPLGFDSFNFEKINREYFTDGRITFNLAGKFEKRKHHAKILNAWSKRFGNDKRYSLQCALYNPFMTKEQNLSLFTQALSGIKFSNINYLAFMPHNKMYNDFLNSGDIVIGMSGGEGWGLPEFQSVALGKHSVILNRNGYTSWANSKNSVLVESNGKVTCEDGIFFAAGHEFNQGTIFDFNEDEFIHSCELAINRAQANKLNLEGLKLQQEFPYSKTVDVILKEVEACL